MTGKLDQLNINMSPIYHEPITIGTLTYLATSAKWHACMFSDVQGRR